MVAGTRPEPGEPGAAETARLQSRAEEAEHARELSRVLHGRAVAELAVLRRRVRALETDLSRLRDEVRERDRLLGMIFRSRSWRFMQALRRMVGR